MFILSSEREVYYAVGDICGHSNYMYMYVILVCVCLYVILVCVCGNVFVHSSGAWALALIMRYVWLNTER